MDWESSKFSLAGFRICDHFFGIMSSRIIQLVLLPIVAFALARPISAAEMVVGNIRVIKVQGKSAEMVDGTGKKTAVQEGVFIRQGTKIITGPDSRVDLVFENGSAVNINPSSQFSIDEFIQDPFNSDGLDYKGVEQAPTTSVTKLGVPEGDILFNVAKQKPGSRFEIATPVGTAGIRGTSGFAGRSGFGLATGTASFQTPAGNTLNVSPGTQVSPNGATGPASPALINAVNSVAAEMRSSTPPNTFLGSPPNLTPDQQNALNLAVAKGGESIVQAASELALSVPEIAPEIAQMAAILAPNDALAIAVSVSQALPSVAPQVAAAVAQVVPTQAPQVAAAVAKTVPESAVAVAQSVSKVVPQQSQNISNAIVEAVPTADARAVQQAATQGASQALPQGSGGATQPGAETRPQPTNPVNPPPPVPQPTPTPQPTLSPSPTPSPTPTPTPIPSGL